MVRSWIRARSVWFICSSLLMRARRDWISLRNLVIRPPNCSVIVAIAVSRVGLEDSIGADISVNIRVK